MFVKRARTLVVALFLGLFGALPSLAQESGTISGRVVDAETGQPVATAMVELLGPRTASTGTDAQGNYRLTVAPGTYALVVSRIGYESQRIDAVRVTAGGTQVVDVRLRSRALLLVPMVVSAARGVEQKADQAPARVEVVTEEEIRNRPAATPIDHLRAVPGVDVATQGLQSGTVVARGFNNIFSGALHMLTDHRVAAIPSLRVNLLHFIPANDEDVERMEVVLGPGSALYGPNTANGVLHVFTKSPLTSQGTVVSMAGGARSYAQGALRTAHLLNENFGVKLSAQYMRADEWEHTDPVEAAARAQALPGNPDTRIGLRDFGLEKWSGELRADWRIDDETTAIFQFGRTSVMNAVELTGVGAGQVDGWTNSFYQLRMNRGRLFAQTYLNTSDAGDTYTLRDGNPIVDRSKLWVAQLQHGFRAADRQNFTYGLDFIRTMPETEGTVHGRNEDDDQYDEFGVYLQSETSLTDRLELVLAGRMDWHSELNDPVFSPRAALVFTPVEGHTFRASYNRAFSTPSSVNLFLDINAGPFPDAALGGLGYGLRAQGTRSTGFTFRNPDGSLTGMRSPFNPQGRHNLIPADIPTMWQLAVGVLAAQGAIDAQTAGFLMQNVPADAQVMKAYLDVLGFQTPRPLTDEVSLDLAPIRESNTTTYEVGYKGLLGDRVLLAADVWFSRKDNFVSALRPSTPLLFMEGQTLGAYAVPRLTQHFMERGMPQAQAQAAATQLVTAMASLPLGVLSSDEVSAAANSSDFLVTYRNFGEVDLWGTDLSARILLTDEFTLGVTASWVNKDNFETEGERIALNAPTTKLSASLGYRNERSGWNGEVRARYTNEFPVMSAPFVATACLGDTGPLVEPCVEAYTLLDVSAGYRLPQIPGASVHLAVTNLFDTGYRAFAGVPEVGRMALLRLRYEF